MKFYIKDRFMTRIDFCCVESADEFVQAAYHVASPNDLKGGECPYCGTKNEVVDAEV